jgi:hypothetical protein
MNLLLTRTPTYNSKNEFLGKLGFIFSSGERGIDRIAKKASRELYGKYGYITSNQTEDGSFYINVFHYKRPFDIFIKDINGNKYILENLHFSFHTGGRVGNLIHKMHIEINYVSLTDGKKYKLVKHLKQRGNDIDFSPPLEINDIIMINEKLNMLIYTIINILEETLNEANKEKAENNIHEQYKNYREYQLAQEADKAEMIRQDEINRQAKINRQAEMVKQAEINRKAEINRQAEKAELIKRAKEQGWGAGLKRRKVFEGGSKQKNKLNSIKTKYLREYCKKNKLKGYSGYNKKDLINFIKNNVTKKLT